MTDRGVIMYICIGLYHIQVSFVSSHNDCVAGITPDVLAVLEKMWNYVGGYMFNTSAFRYVILNYLFTSTMWY